MPQTDEGVVGRHLFFLFPPRRLQRPMFSYASSFASSAFRPGGTCLYNDSFGCRVVSSFFFIVTAAGVSDAFLMTRVTADIHSAVGCHALESRWLVYQNRNERVHCPHCPLSCRPICLPRISQQSIRYLSSACLHLAALFGWLSVMILRKRSLTTCGLPRNVSAVMPVT